MAADTFVGTIAFGAGGYMTLVQSAPGELSGRAGCRSPSIVPEISVVVPVYCEEKNIRPFLVRLEPVLESLGSYEIVFCDDGSTDGTERVIREEVARNRHIRMLRLSRNFGQPGAIMAGIRHCVGRTCVVIDVDLQDPPELISDMYAKLRSGHDVISARRRRRSSDETWARRLTAPLAYRIINAISNVEIPPDTGEFRIMTRRVVDELCRLKEGHGFLRGLVPFVGFKQDFVDFDREDRESGSTRNSYLKKIHVGLDGIVGFSTAPLTAVLLGGLAISGLACLVALWIVVARLLGYPYLHGMATLVVLVAFLGGANLTALGIVGAYVGRVYDEARHRPAFIVDQFVNPPD